MPDPSRKTLSSTEISGVIGVSPYLTRRAIFDRFHDGIDIDAKDNRRMDFGKFVQKYICMRTSDAFNLEVIENEKDEYRRHKTIPVGATIDGHLNCPTRGRGIVEAKSISYQVFKESWTDTRAPLHIETQVQCALLVTGWDWAVIAAMIGADEGFRFFERRPDKKAFKRIADEAKQFFADVKAHRRPAAFGSEIEMRGIDRLWPESKPRVIYEAPRDFETGDLLRRYHYHREQRLFHSKAEDQLKVQILDRAKDASEMKCYGANAKIKKTRVPSQKIVKEEHVRSSIYVEPIDDVDPLPEQENGWTA